MGANVGICLLYTSTLVYHSHGMQLVQHEPFQSRQKAIEEGLDIKSTNFVLEFNSQRMMAVSYTHLERGEWKDRGRVDR